MQQPQLKLNKLRHAKQSATLNFNNEGKIQLESIWILRSDLLLKFKNHSKSKRFPRTKISPTFSEIVLVVPHDKLWTILRSM